MILAFIFIPALIIVLFLLWLISKSIGNAADSEAEQELRDWDIIMLEREEDSNP